MLFIGTATAVFIIMSRGHNYMIYSEDRFHLLFPLYNSDIYISHILYCRCWMTEGTPRPICCMPTHVSGRTRHLSSLATVLRNHSRCRKHPPLLMLDWDSVASLLSNILRDTEQIDVIVGTGTVELCYMCLDGETVAEDGRRRERIFSVLFVCVCVRGGEILMHGWHSVFASLLVISKFSFVAPVAE